MMLGAIPMKGRVNFAAVKRSCCHGCGGTYMDESVQQLPEGCRPCVCPNGWSGMETSIPIHVSSGAEKKGFFARAWAGVFNNNP